MTHTPILMTKGGVSQLAATAEEYYNLTWLGWSSGDTAPPPDPSAVPATLRLLQDEVTPLQGRVGDLELELAATIDALNYLAAEVGQDGGGTPGGGDPGEGEPEGDAGLIAAFEGALA